MPGPEYFTGSVTTPSGTSVSTNSFTVLNNGGSKLVPVC